LETASFLHPWNKKAPTAISNITNLPRVCIVSHQIRKPKLQHTPHLAATRCQMCVNCKIAK
jgi:hypothetical protein